MALVRPWASRRGVATRSMGLRGALYLAVLLVQVQGRYVDLARLQAQGVGEVVAAGLVLQLVGRHGLGLALVVVDPDQLMTVGRDDAYLIVAAPGNGHVQKVLGKPLAQGAKGILQKRGQAVIAREQDQIGDHVLQGGCGHLPVHLAAGPQLLVQEGRLLAALITVKAVEQGQQENQGGKEQNSEEEQDLLGVGAGKAAGLAFNGHRILFRGGPWGAGKSDACGG